MSLECATKLNREYYNDPSLVEGHILSIYITFNNFSSLSTERDKTIPQAISSRIQAVLSTLYPSKGCHKIHFEIKLKEVFMFLDIIFQEIYIKYIITVDEIATINERNSEKPIFDYYSIDVLKFLTKSLGRFQTIASVYECNIATDFVRSSYITVDELPVKPFTDDIVRDVLSDNISIYEQLTTLRPSIFYLMVIHF